MSMKNAVSFYEKLEGDLELQKRVGKAGSRENLEHLVRDELGYDFTQEEMQKVIFERNPELSDEELEAVAGGYTGETGNPDPTTVAITAGAIATGIGVTAITTTGIVMASAIAAAA